MSEVYDGYRQSIHQGPVRSLADLLSDIEDSLVRLATDSDNDVAGLMASDIL